MRRGRFFLATVVVLLAGQPALAQQPKERAPLKWLSRGRRCRKDFGAAPFEKLPTGSWA